jgi:hypothetical protein
MIGPALALLAQLVSPSAFVLGALAEHSIVFVGDIHPYAEPKQIITAVLRTMSPEHPVRLLALEIAAEQQPMLDRYFATVPEDTTILLNNPRTLRDHWGASEDYLGIYRAAWAWNAGHPEAPIRVAAIDVPRWPLFQHSEAMAAGTFAERDRIMAARFERELKVTGGGSALVFMGGLHGLRSIGGEVHAGRAVERFDHWFAGYVEADGHPVYTVLIDAPLGDGQGATRVYDLLLAQGGSVDVATVLDASSDDVAEPMRSAILEGYGLAFAPARFHLREAAQAMIILHHPTALTPLR